MGDEDRLNLDQTISVIARLQHELVVANLRAGGGIVLTVLKLGGTGLVGGCAFAEKLLTRKCR